MCVKCKTLLGTVRFPCTNEKAIIWSRRIAVKQVTGKNITFNGKKGHFLCQVCTYISFC
jgi:hypothetical protein